MFRIFILDVLTIYIHSSYKVFMERYVLSSSINILISRRIASSRDRSSILKMWYRSKCKFEYYLNETRSIFESEFSIFQAWWLEIVTRRNP